MYMDTWPSLPQHAHTHTHTDMYTCMHADEYSRPQYAEAHMMIY